MEALATPMAHEEGWEPYSFAWGTGEENETMEIDPTAAIKAICEDLRFGVEVPVIAARFHQAVAQMVAETCVRAREATDIHQVGLSGGVFQNVLLLQLTTSRLDALGFEVLCHRQVPPNDGGIALGQALLAQAYLSAGS